MGSAGRFRAGGVRPEPGVPVAACWDGRWDCFAGTAGEGVSSWLVGVKGKGEGGGWTDIFSALVPARKVAARRRRVFWNCIFVFRTKFTGEEVEVVLMSWGLECLGDLLLGERFSREYGAATL